MDKFYAPHNFLTQGLSQFPVAAELTRWLSPGRVQTVLVIPRRFVRGSLKLLKLLAKIVKSLKNFSITFINVIKKEPKILIFSTIFIFSAQNAQAAGDFSLNSLIQECLKNNPRIQAAKYRYEAAKARISLLRSLEDPKLEFEYDKINADMDAVMKGRTAPMRTISISQGIPFPTKLTLNKQAAQKEADVYEQEYKEIEHKVIKELKEAYFNLFLNRKRIELTKDNLQLISHFIEITNKKYTVDKANKQDSLKAQVEYSKLSNQLVLLEQEVKISQAMLESVLNKSVDFAVLIPQVKDSKTLKLQEEDILRLSRENRPELRAFQDMMRKTEIDYARAKQEYLPDFMLKYRREEIDGSLGEWSAMVGVTVPLWFSQKQNSFVKEAKANVEVLKAEYRAAENMVLLEARSAFARFEAAKNLVKIYETGVLPQALAALESAKSGYEADKIDFLEVIDSLRTLRDFQAEYYEASANLEIYLADLERAIGTELGK